MTSKEAEKAGMAEGKGVPAPAKGEAPAGPGKLPASQHKKRWGGVEYPSDSFVRVTFLKDGGLAGERWRRGTSSDVPKSVFESALAPKKIAKLWEKPKPAAVAKRPATDVGNFRRH